jgi:hypothetical protein
MVQRGRWSGKHVQPLLVKGSENKGFSDGCAFEMELKEWVGFRDKKKRNTKGLRLGYWRARWVLYPGLPAFSYNS